VIEDDELLLRKLACLPPVEPGIEWEAQVRKRCHAVISRRAASRVRAGERGVSLPGIAVAAALFIYLAAVVTEALRLGGVL